MKQKEKKLTSSLEDLLEAVYDLKLTLETIGRCLSNGCVLPEDAAVILGMLPEPPVSEEPLHLLPMRASLEAKLTNTEEADTAVLLTFRDYFEGVQDVYAREIRLLQRELQALREERDLADLNDWWKHCDATEREIAFAAIAAATGIQKPERLLATPRGELRIMLLARGMEAIDRVYAEAAKQTLRFQALPDKEKQTLMKSVENHTGISAKKWWNKATLVERTKVLGQLMDALENSKQQESPEKRVTNVA